MPTVIGIRFKDSGKTYFFDPNGHAELRQGDPVIVETVRGPELAKVAFGNREVADSEIIGELKPVLRRAEQNDFDRLRVLNERQDDLLARCAEKIREHALPMRLVKAEYSFDGSRLTFYFTAEKRVDFRMLVRDLARTFRTRIELRQIGPRDEAKLLGGIGPCGRLLCCATFLPDYARVSIKMAKDQDLPLNPSKISGVCGRLLCCLSYEHDQYLTIKAEMPRKGTWVQTPEGPGEVVSVNVVRETVMVELAVSGIQEEFKPEQLQEATRQVADLARSRNEEGITPLTQRRPGREPKHHGERRLLRDEIASNPDVLDALALLEDGDDLSELDLSAYEHDERRPPRGQPREERPRGQHQGERGSQHQGERGPAGEFRPRPPRSDRPPHDERPRQPREDRPHHNDRPRQPREDRPPQREDRQRPPREDRMLPPPTDSQPGEPPERRRDEQRPRPSQLTRPTPGQSAAEPPAPHPAEDEQFRDAGPGRPRFRRKRKQGE